MTVIQSLKESLGKKMAQLKSSHDHLNDKKFTVGTTGELKEIILEIEKTEVKQGTIQEVLNEIEELEKADV